MVAARRGRTGAVDGDAMPRWAFMRTKRERTAPQATTNPRQREEARTTMARMSLKVYTLSNCDRCRAATKWLRTKGIPFTEIAIRETPPSVAELRTMSAATGDLRRLFNTSGKDYREQNIGAKLDAMLSDEAFALLHGNGNLVKRPFAIGDGVALVGFEAATWAKAFGRK